jgi:hypothetical protein
MMGLLRFACLAIVFAAVLRCESQASNPLDNPEIRMATIHGFVTDGGSPISGAEVSLTGPGLTRTVSSDANGFTFADLPPGSYTLTVVLTGFVCQPATAETVAGGIITANVVCAKQPVANELGTISGTVTAGGAPIPGIWIRVTSPGLERRVVADTDGAFTLTLPPGAYAMIALVPATTCESAIVEVEKDRTVTTDIVCQPAGGIAGRVQWPDGSSILGARVVVIGPVSREAVISAQEEFRFGTLPPGVYTLTASALTACESATATVRVAQVTDVEILCQLTGKEIEGSWFMYFPRESDFGFIQYSQTGGCPPLLPEDNAIRSIGFDSANGIIAIRGLDPALTIAGTLHTSCENCGGQTISRGFSGTGSAVRAGGAAIRSELTGEFGVSSLSHYYFFGSITRVHRSPADSLVCTETYRVEGVKSQ